MRKVSEASITVHHWKGERIAKMIIWHTRGQVERFLTASQCRRLAKALTQAADEMEKK